MARTSTTARSTTATRRTTTTRKKAKPAITAGPGERLWFLDLPFGAAAHGARRDPARKAWVYSGGFLPEPLVPYRSQPFTYQRWLEDEANGRPGPGMSGVARMEPRDLQTEGAAAIVAAARAGARGFLLTDETGTGKTGTAWLAVREICRARGAKNVLVLVDRPKEITIPHWRRTIAALGDGGLRVLISSPDNLDKLIARNGRPRFRFDVIVADEAHLYRNLATERVSRFRRVARYGADHDEAPFLLMTTATPGNHPVELTYLSALLAQVHAEPAEAWDAFPQRLITAGIPLERGAYGAWVWSEQLADDPQLQSEATGRIRSWLTDHRPPLTLYRAAPWGPAPLDLLPVDLAPSERAAYETVWAEFEQAVHALRAEKAVTAKKVQQQGRTAVLRFRQKASLVRVPSTVAWVKAQVASGFQVVVSCEFVSAAAEPITEALEAAGIEVARLFGSAADQVRGKEAERLRFQTGVAPVAVLTATSSLSLQAGEQLQDGSTATSTPRVGVMHNVRYSGLQGRQVLGRTHRDHQICPWWLGFAEDTVEARVAQIMIGRFKSAGDTAGADSTALHEIAELLGVGWLPPEVLATTEAS